MSSSPPVTERLIVAVGQAPQLARLRRRAVESTRVTHRLRIPVMPIREELPHLLNNRGLLGCGVEVGVKRGEFSELLLERWQGRHLISIDPWAEAPGDEYVDVANVHQAEHDAYYAETVGRVQRFGERSSVWRQTGGEAARSIPHHCLDFAYLDARHDRESVLEDLATWTSKVRPGGILAGHDYVDGHFPEGDFGVRGAVDEHFGRLGWRVRSTFADPPWFSWWVEVPR